MIRLIVIDEDESVRISIRQMLQGSKLQVVAESDSGARILAGIEQFQPHVILLDMPLENDDSFTALRQAKSKYPEIPLLMLSTFDDPITASRAAGLGASGVLLKPLNRKQIIQEVKGVYKHVLTEEIAKQFVTDDNSVDLSEFTVIESDAARVLKRHNGPLHLSSLAELTEAAAESLSRHNGILRLDGLSQISNEAAEIFIVHKGALYLDSLSQLTEASAESFGKHEGYKLSLNGLASLSSVTAEHLSRHGYWFESDEREIYGDLCLDGLTELSDAAAESFSKHKGALYLDGLTQLSNAAAESLSKHRGSLSLSGLTVLSDTGASHLAKHPYLYINLDNLPASAAQILRDARQEQKGDATADNWFSFRSGPWTLGRISHPVFQLICGCCREETIANLEYNETGRPYLDAIFHAEELGWSVNSSNSERDGWDGWIEEGYDEVIRCPHCTITDPCPNCGKTGLIAIAGEESPICMECEMERLAETLGIIRQDPSPPSTKFTRDKMGDVLTEELANEFLAGNLLFLSNFKDINFAAAQLLGHCDKKKLILNDLTVLDDASAEALSEYPGDLRLIGLKDISDTAAQHLAKHSKLTITLDNLSDSAAQILRDAGHWE